MDAEGRESALAATSFGQSSKVTVKGQFIDNAQSFDKPNQPTLPLGLSILTEGIDYGFTIAWSDVADFTGQRLNLFVDGVCIKVGINGDEASYYENRLATGTYEVEVRSQYTSNNVESFGLKKTVSIKADPGLTGKTPAELADPAYSEYKEPTTTAAVETTTTAAAETTTVATAETTTPVAVETTTPAVVETTTPVTVETTTPAVVETTTLAAVETTTTTAKTTTVAPTPTTTAKVTTTQKTTAQKVSVGNTRITKIVKTKKSAKVIYKKIAKVSGYQLQLSRSSKFKKAVTKTTKKVSYKFKKLKANKKYYVRVRGYVKTSNGTTYGKWRKKNFKTAK